MEQKTCWKGDHLPRADRLRRLPEQRARLRARRREAARARGADEGDLDADAAVRAEPDPLAPRLPRHVGARARGDLDVLVLLPRARARSSTSSSWSRGTRMHTRYFQAGGLAEDIPRGFFTECRKFVERMPQAVDELRGRSSTGTRSGSSGRRASAAARPTTRSRSGSPGRCCARSGRRLGPAARRAVPRLRPGRLRGARSTTNGDVYDRYRVRMDEMRESTKHRRASASTSSSAWSGSRGSPTTARSCCRRARSCTPRWSRLIHHFKIVTEGYPRARGRGLRRGRVAARRVGCYLVSDGGPKPWRRQVPRARRSSRSRRPRRACADALVADLIAIVGSLDTVMGEVDR